MTLWLSFSLFSFDRKKKHGTISRAGLLLTQQRERRVEGWRGRERESGKKRNGEIGCVCLEGKFAFLAPDSHAPGTSKERKMDREIDR